MTFLGSLLKWHVTVHIICLQGTTHLTCNIVGFRLQSWLCNQT